MIINITDKTNISKEINIKLPVIVINSKLFWKMVAKSLEKKYKIN